MSFISSLSLFSLYEISFITLTSRIFNLYAINCATKQVEGKLAKDQCEYNAECQYYFNNNGDKCVIMDKSAGRCRSYDVKQGTLLNEMLHTKQTTLDMYFKK